jgi:hypothetical protein
MSFHIHLHPKITTHEAVVVLILIGLVIWRA